MTDIEKVLGEAIKYAKSRKNLDATTTNYLLAGILAEFRKWNINGE